MIFGYKKSESLHHLIIEDVTTDVNKTIFWPCIEGTSCWSSVKLLTGRYRKKD